jgi:hypothetical protein
VHDGAAPSHNEFMVDRSGGVMVSAGSCNFRGSTRPEKVPMKEDPVIDTWASDYYRSNDTNVKGIA